MLRSAVAAKSQPTIVGEIYGHLINLRLYCGNDLFEQSDKNGDHNCRDARVEQKVLLGRSALIVSESGSLVGVFDGGFDTAKKFLIYIEPKGCTVNECV